MSFEAYSRPMRFRIPVRVVFCNRSRRIVRPVWLNPNGEPIIHDELEPEVGTKALTTLIGHRWVFKDAETDQLLWANGKELFRPRRDKNGNAVVVNITSPVYRVCSLWDRTLEVIRSLVQPEDYRKLEIPPRFIKELEDQPSELKDLHCMNQQDQHLLESIRGQRT